MTLLRLYRKHPDVIPAAEWALRIVSILDDQNLVSAVESSNPATSLILLFSSNSQGVALAVASLVLTLAQDNLEAYAVCYQKAVSRLSKVSEIRPFRRESRPERRCFAGRPQKRILERLRLLQSSCTVATSQAPSSFAVLPSLR